MEVSEISPRDMPATLDDLGARIDGLLGELGAGLHMSSVAYDTAWVARLHAYYPQCGFEAAAEWVRRHQMPDGSWGSPIAHAHDRVISTLSCLIALRALGAGDDAARVKRAEAALWRLCGHLRYDVQDTIGFPLLSVALTREALSRGCDVPREFGVESELARRKLALILENPGALRRSTLFFSMEGLSPLPIDDGDLLEGTGLVAASPAATAALLERRCDDTALTSLRSLVAARGDGGVDDLHPIDLFEIAWSLNHLRAAGAITPDSASVRRPLEQLWRSWSPASGISSSSRFKIPDADDTAAGFSALLWGGSPVTPDCFVPFAREDGFCTFPHEADASTSTNIHVIAALRSVGEDARAEGWIETCLAMLKKYRKDSALWFDKWHVSPYYATCEAVQAICGRDDALIEPSIHWIRRTQREDGGWGYHGGSTAEETAYAIQALIRWRRGGGQVEAGQLAAGARYLYSHIDAYDFPPLWVGKGLYTPRRVVRAAVLSALYAYLTR